MYVYRRPHVIRRKTFFPQFLLAQEPQGVTAGASISTESSQAATVDAVSDIASGASLSTEVSTITVSTPITLTLSNGDTDETPPAANINVGATGPTLGAGVTLESAPAITIGLPGINLFFPSSTSDETQPSPSITTPTSLTSGAGVTTESSQPINLTLAINLTAGAGLSTESSQPANVDTPAIDLTLDFGDTDETPPAANISLGTAPINVTPGSSPTTESSQPATVGTPISLTLAEGASTESGLSTTTVGNAQIVTPGAGITSEAQNGPTVESPTTITLGVGVSSELPAAPLVRIGQTTPLSRTIIMTGETRRIAA